MNERNTVFLLLGFNDKHYTACGVYNVHVYACLPHTHSQQFSRTCFNEINRLIDWLIDWSLQSSAECTWITTRRLVHGPVAVLTATVGRAVVRQLEPWITRILGHVAVLTTVKPHASVLYVAWFHRARSCSVDKPSEISPTDNKPTPVLLLGRIYTWLSISFWACVRPREFKTFRMFMIFFLRKICLLLN